MAIDVSTIRECFYIPGKPGIIDIVHPITGRGVYSGEGLVEIQEKDHGAVIGNFDKVVDEQDDYWRRPPVEITEERWWEMLGVLPPVGWKHGPGWEVFKLQERTSGAVTAIFCRLGERYFEMQDSIFMKPDRIIAKCREVKEQEIV